MKTIKLGDLLNDQQVQGVVDILNSNQPESVIIHNLKAYLNEFKDELEKNGVVSDYLAYVLLYLHQTGKLP